MHSSYALIVDIFIGFFDKQVNNSYLFMLLIRNFSYIFNIMTKNKMLKFTSINQETPDKRSTNGRKEDFHLLSEDD